jgi:hypothetical protein
LERLCGRESLHECGEGVLNRGDIGRRNFDDFLGTSDEKKTED